MNKYKNVDEIIDTYPPAVKELVQKIRNLIKKEIPEAEELLSYDVPAFRLGKNTVMYAGFKNHIGFYPTPSVIEKFRSELSEYELSEGTIRFPIDKPLPLSLILKMAKYKLG
jgi:uncharacterized protein YdhG (YjbR/CyaY superfamily)